MSFLKKLVQGVGKVVGTVAGIASKILPGPLGAVAKGVSGIAAKLVPSPEKSTPPASVNAEAIKKVLPPVPSASTSTLSLGKIPKVGEILKPKSWFEKNLAWLIPSVLTVLGFIVWLFNRKK